MTIERVQYIDAIKGFAIFLMVMGHVISSFFVEPGNVLVQGDRSLMLLFRLIYSFHMPLLFFCSGMVTVHFSYTWKSFSLTLWRRFCSLIIPFFSVGCLRYVVGGPFLDYWFLWILFQFIVITMIIDHLSHMFSQYGNRVTAVSLLIVSFAAYFISKFYSSYEKMPFCDIEHWQMYVYFVFGFLFCRFDKLKEFLKKDWLYTIALTSYVCLTYIVIVKGVRFPGISYINSIIALLAIISIVYLFREQWDDDSIVISCFRKMGVHSLEIYLIHFFVLCPFYNIGSYMRKLANASGGGKTVIFAEFCMSVLITVVIVALSMLIVSIINKSGMLSFVILGRKKK